MCSDVARASRLKVWKTKPISLLRMRASSSSLSEETSWPLSQYWPLGGRVEAADEVHQRGLAGAGGAHDGDVLVMADADVDAAQGVHLLVAHLVGLPEIVGDDDLAGVRWVEGGGGRGLGGKCGGRHG